MITTNTLVNPWRGSVAITPGIGAFLGESGDNKPHGNPPVFRVAQK